MNHGIKHMAFIPDGNRRWAKDRGLPTLEGHRKGYNLAKDLAGWCLDRGIPEVSFWGFSTENWKRSKEEVGYLMDLFLTFVTKDLDQFAQKGMRMKVMGRRADLSEKLQKAIERAEEETAQNTKGQFNLCFNYGGRPEILEGVKQCLREGMDAEDLSEEDVQSRLWTANMQSDIDVIVRTSGEQRLSGFQPWRGAYAELYFSQMHWPDFSEEELDRIIDWYGTRERRFGGDSKKR